MKDINLNATVQLKLGKLSSMGRFEKLKERFGRSGRIVEKE